MLLMGMLLINSHITFAQKGKIEWFAHRSFVGLHPENTIEGMKRALHYKAVVLEMDLAITSDKQVVVSHDPVLNRKITLGPDGAELSTDQKIAIYNTPYNQLRMYDVGTKPNSKFPNQLRYKAHIPLFSNLIDSVELYAKQEKLAKPVYFIETKLKPETDGKYHPAPEEFVDLMLAVIFDKGIQDRVIIQSFDARTLQIIRQKHPNIPVAFLTKINTTLEDNLKLLGFVPNYYSVKSDLITVAFLEKCKNLGMAPIVGALNSYDDFVRLKKLGVSGFISDYPIEYLKKHNK